MKRCGFDCWVGKTPWNRKWQPTPVLLLGKFHGQRSLAGYSPWGYKELSTTEQLSTNAQNRAGQQPQTWRTNAGALGKAGRDRLGVWDWHEHTIIFKIDDQLGPTVQHKEFCSVFCNNLNGKRIWKKKYMYSPITELFCYTPKTNTLLTNYGSI